MNIPSLFGNDKLSDEEYQEIMEQAYKEPDYLSPHDINSGLDDFGYPIIEEEFTDYVDLRLQNLFVGVYPLDTILDGIEGQFQDYMNIEDPTNYVDIFYVQWGNSVNIIRDDENEIHKQELLDRLDYIKDDFVGRIKYLFESRLTISILAMDDESTPEIDEAEIVIRMMYEFFILKAKDNFVASICGDLSMKTLSILDDNELSNAIDSQLHNYSPFVTCMTPTKFLEYCEADDIKDLYEDGKVSGNFLRKYTPKLYQNEEFKVEIISNIMAINEMKNRYDTTEGDIDGKI